MASASAMIGLFFMVLSTASSQHLGTTPFYNPAGICLSIHSNNLASMQRKLKDCVVIVGNLRLVIMETTVSSDFANISFPNLREITGFLVLYRVIGLETIGQLFPNLTRIRGEQLINNYALVVHDMPNLREIGLYSLLKIDRGGVSIWGGTHTCFIDTVDWNSIAPNASHSLTYPKISAHCNTPRKPCKCGAKKSNHCWNNKVNDRQRQTSYPTRSEQIFKKLNNNKLRIHQVFTKNNYFDEVDENYLMKIVTTNITDKDTHVKRKKRFSGIHDIIDEGVDAAMKKKSATVIKPYTAFIHFTVCVVLLLCK